MLTSAMLVLLMITPVFGFFEPIPALLIGLPAGLFCFYMNTLVALGSTGLYSPAYLAWVNGNAIGCVNW
jgi:hypothetical protein